MHKCARIAATIAAVGMAGFTAMGATAASAAATPSNWVQLSPGGGNSAPPAMAGSSLVYDATSQQELLTGGFDGNASVAGNWNWNGSAWTQLSASAPGGLARSYAQTAYDPATGNVILFGGQGGTNNGDFYNDTFRWNPSTKAWDPVTVAGNVPSKRAFGAFAWDPGTNQMVLFGGQNSTSTFPNAVAETWTWNDSTSTWTKLQPTTEPTARFGASMVYDAAIGKLVLFGGNDGAGGTSQETWEWDGSNWTNLNLTSAQSPTARYGASMAYDPAIGAPVLYGGTDTAGTVLTDTWIFDGATWTQGPVLPNPGTRFAAPMNYDPVTQQTLLFGGGSANSTTNHADTWGYETTSSAPTGLTATPGNGSVTLNWSAPPANGGSTITGYDIYEGTSAGGESVTPVNPHLVNGTSYPVSGLSNGTTYYFTVEAVNAYGSSPASNEVAAMPTAPANPTPPTPPANGQGYDLVASDGGVFSFGGDRFYGSTGNMHLNKPVVGMAQSPGDSGYWLVASDGGVFTFGGATFEGSAGNLALAQPIVGMAATPDGHGYWLVAADGGIFSYGDAAYFGSLPGTAHTCPAGGCPAVVGMAATPDGHGYWEVLANGQVYNFGDAGAFGSVTGALYRPIVGMAATPDGKGYWLVASDGGVFSFGDAPFKGSAGNIHLAQPVVGMASTSTGQGYWLVASDGGVFTYGDAAYEGSTGGTHLNRPVVGMSA